MLEHRVAVRPNRRRDAAATREAILEAAIHRFASQGYERAGVRDIAGDAGVTAALVNRYFGSKEGLFSEAVERAFALRDLIGDGERATLAEGLARRMVYGGGTAPDHDRISRLFLLRSAAEPRAAEILLPHLNARLRSLAECLGGPDADARAAVILAQLAGFAMLHELLRPRALEDAPRERLVRLLSGSLATFIG
jgi:AcrR family transcriptional regulator